jgi:hypothetical protein
MAGIRVVAAETRQTLRYPASTRFLKQEAYYRRTIYLRNLIAIRAHNLKYQQGLTRYRQAPNSLADLSEDEFSQFYRWAHSPEHVGLGATDSCNGSIMDSPNPPLELDWGNKVSAVLDQGTCGMDWAIVAVGAVESLYALKVGQLPTLSVQQLLECSEAYGNEGCYGGFMDQAFQYIIDFGIATQKSYPERTPAACRYVPNMKFTGFSKCARVPSGNHSKLISAIMQHPVSVALDFSTDMKFYSGGIYDGVCTTQLTHAMLLTGYGGKEHGTHYWRLRNTLGTTWGNKGYIDLLRDDKDGAGACGIQVWPSVPQNIL